MTPGFGVVFFEKREKEKVSFFFRRISGFFFFFSFLQKNFKTFKNPLFLTVRQRHVHPDQRRAGEHPDGGRSERERQVGRDHRGVADEQDPEVERVFFFKVGFFFFFRDEFFFLSKSGSFFSSLNFHKKNSLPVLRTCSCP